MTMTSPITDMLTDPCGGTFDVESIVLKHGSHLESSGEFCLVEAANRAAFCIPELREMYGAPSKFGFDHPSISRVVRSFCIAYNDGLPDDETRTRILRPYVRKILGTKTTDADEETRAWLAVDWLVRVQTPAWLDLAGLTDDAAALRALPPLTSGEDCAAVAVQSLLKGALTRAYAAEAAAWAAAGDAVGDAAGAVAGAVAGDATWAAAIAGAAAGAAAGKWLAPTLQVSACEVLDRMIAMPLNKPRKTKHKPE